jgi:beta-glucosidase
VALAQTADVAIVYAGLTAEWESEGFDRADMKLPGGQDELIRRVAGANPKTIVVLNSGSPVEMPWVDDVPALLQVWYPGQEAGHAVADVLFGDASPSGRLPTTFPRRLPDNPAYINYPGENGHVRYGEGLFIGYRYYDAKQIEPLFPFGHGLTYTTFAYGDLEVESEQYGPGEEIKARITVANTGDRPAQEVVQLYVRETGARLARPPKELKRFAKITLQPGETQEVTFVLNRDDLAFYDPARGGWRTEAGEYELLVGASAEDIRGRARFGWRGDPAEVQPGHRLHTGLPLGSLLGEPEGRQVLKRHLGDLLEHPQLDMALAMTLDQLSSLVPDILTPQMVEAIRQDLAEL